jgi:hypothetical protein
LYLEIAQRWKPGAAKASTDLIKDRLWSIYSRFSKGRQPWLSPALTGYGFLIVSF